MSLSRSNPLSSSRRHLVSTLAALGTVLVAGSALTACSSSSPLEPATPAQALAPTGPSQTGFQVGWGVTGGDASTQTTTTLAPTAKDSAKAKTK